MRSAACLFAAAGVALAAASCNGTTGGALVTFPAFARGAPGASQPFPVGDFQVQLTAARMRIGAVYFDAAPPAGSGFNGPVCIASGVFVAQVPGPVTIDLLSTEPQEFSVFGNGAAGTALSWQLWLTDGDVNLANFAHVVDLAGVATAADGRQFSFGAIVTINDNRLPVTSDPAQPGLNPICKQRIIQLGDVAVDFFPGGTLDVTVDPRAWFNLDIDFASLPVVTDSACLSADTLVPTNPADYALAPEAPPPAGQTCGGSGQPCCAGQAGSPPAPAGGCLGSLTCNVGVCGPTYCIPNSSLATGLGATAGVDFFAGIQTGGAAAYAVSYFKQR